MLRSVVAFRVGGLLRREMLIFATPPVCIARISSCHEITQFKPLSVTTILNLKARYDVTMSIGPPRMREIHTRVHPKSIFAKDLNRLQTEALNTSGDNSVAYIWGPPGTGKTTTMGSLVAALTELGQKVLLISKILLRARGRRRIRQGEHWRHRS